MNEVKPTPVRPAGARSRELRLRRERQGVRAVERRRRPHARGPPRPQPLPCGGPQWINCSSKSTAVVDLDRRVVDRRVALNDWMASAQKNAREAGPSIQAPLDRGEDVKPARHPNVLSRKLSPNRGDQRGRAGTEDVIRILVLWLAPSRLENMPEVAPGRR